MLPPIFIVIWILTGVALAVYIARIAIRIQTKKLGYHLSTPSASSHWRWKANHSKDGRFISGDWSGNITADISFGNRIIWMGAGNVAGYPGRQLCVGFGARYEDSPRLVRVIGNLYLLYCLAPLSPPFFHPEQYLTVVSLVVD